MFVQHPPLTPPDPAQFQRERLRRLAAIGGLLATLLLTGTLGYYVIEGWSVLDAAYMTVITLSTVGFGEVYPLSTTGRAFTILLVLGGVGAATYALSSLYNIFLSDDARVTRRTRRRQRMIDRLQGHTIVCGYGRMGRHVALSLDREGLPYVVIDRDKAAVAKCESEGHLAVVGNAANGEMLERAGIARARSLIASVSSDAENVFIVLTARGMREDLQIIARANFEDTEDKLRRAGADRVILPYAVAGQRMASLIVRPAVADFLDVVMHSDALELWLEEVAVAPGSAIAGQTLADVRPRQNYGVNVLALIPPGEPMHTYPNAADRFEAGARIIVMGTRAGLDAFRQLAARDAEA